MDMESFDILKPDEFFGRSKLSIYDDDNFEKVEYCFKYLQTNFAKVINMMTPYKFLYYLPDFNTVIEFDGQQHFGEVEVFGGLERFLYTKENDDIKTKYCEKNNLKLVRIPYWEFKNVCDVLDKTLYVK